jgi:dihydrofolate reductase
MAEPLISLVAAVARNGIIGREGALPWRLKSDLQAFRRLTMGHPIIMGRKTFDSIGRPLDGRDNIVVTRSGAALPEGVLAAGSVEEAIALARRIAGERGLAEIFIIGGAQIYAASLPLAERIHLTEIQADVTGDASLELPRERWREVSRQHHTAGRGDDFAYDSVVLERHAG